MLDDFDGFRRHAIPLDAIVIDSPWATQYNTWEFNPHQFPDAPGMVRMLRADGVRTVVWVHAVGQPRLARRPDPAAAGVRAAAPRARAELRARRRPPGTSSATPSGEPFVRQWWMGTGSPVDFTSPAAEAGGASRPSACSTLGVEGIKADDGDGYYIPDDAQLCRRPQRGRRRPGTLGGLHRLALQRALDEVHPGPGVLFGRSGWTGQHADRAHLGRRSGVGLLVAARARRGDAGRRRAAASRTGRTTSAATSATGWSSAARRSCWSAGCSSVASRR